MIPAGSIVARLDVHGGHRHFHLSHFFLIDLKKLYEWAVFFAMFEDILDVISPSLS